MIKEISKYIVLIFIGVAVLSCNKKDIYFSYKTVSASGWNKDSLTRFDVKNKNSSNQNRNQRPARPKNPAISTPKTLKKRNDKENQ